MKKIIAIILALTCIVGLVGCSNNSMNHIIKTKPNVTGIVQEVHDDYIMMYSDSAKGYPNGSRWQISLNVENKDSYTTLTVGDKIVVYHNGQVMETEPLKVGKVFAITLKTPADRTKNEGDPVPENVQPVGTPVDEVFDITVSYANWGELNEIYTKALNTDKMAISSVRHLPIYKFDTLVELEQFKTDIDGILSIDHGYDEIPSFNEATAKYDEKFFTENTLMLVYVESGSGSYRYGVDSIYHADGNFCIHIKQTNNPEFGTDDMAGWFITVAVPDTMIADCSVFDADFNIANY